MKRGRSALNGIETPKRQKSEGEDTPTSLQRSGSSVSTQDLCVDDEVKTLRFQHQVMYKRVKQKQDELSHMEKSMQALNTQKDQLNDYLFEVHHTWGQLASDLRAMCQQLVVKTADVDLIQTLASGAKEKKNALFPFVELFCKSQPPSAEDEGQTSSSSSTTRANLRESLSATALQTQEVVKTLIQALNEREEENRALNQTVRQLAPDGAQENGMAVLLSQNDKLFTEAENLKNELAELQRVHRKQAADYSELRKRESSFRADLGDVRGEMEILRWELVKLQRKYEACMNNINSSNSSSCSSSNSGDDPSSSTESATPAQKHDMDELEVQLEELKQVSETRLTELEQLKSQNISLQNQISDLKIAAQPAELAAASFLRQIHALKQELLTTKALQQKTAADVKKEQTARLNEEQGWNDSLAKHSSLFQERERELQHQLDEVTNQLTKAETERDEVKARLDADGGSPALISEYATTNHALLVENTALKEELAGLQEAKGLKTDARVRHFLYRRCISKQKANEIKEAEIKASLTAVQELAAAENSDLLEQIADLKGIEARQQSEIEAYKALVTELSREAEADELRSELADQRATAEELTTMLDDMAKSNEDTQEQNQKLVAQCHALEKAIAKLTSASKKNQQLHNLLRQEKELIARKCDVQAERGKSATIIMKEEAERLKTMTEQRANWKKQLDNLEFETQNLREIMREKAATLEQTKEDLAKKNKGYGEASQRLTKELKDNEEREKKLRLLNEKNASLARKVERARAKAAAAQEAQAAHLAQPAPEVVVDRVLETELRLLKQRVRCSVCSDRDKSVVITKCFHLFCGPCIESNLKVRLRKCPGCGVSFGEQDVHPIYLT